MTSLVVAAFLASLAGSLHCAGMCGPFAAFWASAGPGERSRAAAAYHGVRLITYTGLGALAGALGQALEFAAGGRLRAVAALLAGLLLVAWGLVGLARHAGLRLSALRALPVTDALGGLFRRLSGALRGLPPLRRAAMTGLLTTLLPCGWLHAFVLAAAATGSPVMGAALMAAFWAGTVPMLTAVGAGLLAATGPLRRHAPAISAACVLLAGVVALVVHARALAAPAPCHDPNAATTQRLVHEASR